MEHHYAGLWIRLAATLVDIIVLGLLSLLLFGNQSGGDGYVYGYFGWETIIPIAYYALFFYFFSASLGKMLFKLQIIGLDGVRAPLSICLVRSVCYFTSFVPFGLGFIWIAFDKHKQGWHDKMVKTYVIHK